MEKITDRENELMVVRGMKRERMGDAIVRESGMGMYVRACQVTSVVSNSL